MFNVMLPTANPLSNKPDCLNDEKKFGPTCRPILKTNSIRPKSFIKCDIDGLRVKPKCETIIPTKSTNVEPSDIPLNFSFPSTEPTATTKAKIITVRPTDSLKSNDSNQFIFIHFFGCKIIQYLTFVKLNDSIRIINKND